jgi:hypothetical protein
MMETPGVRSRSVSYHAPAGARGASTGGAFAGTLVDRSLVEIIQPSTETEMRFES